MNHFEIHPTLRADCHVLAKLSYSYLLLHRNASLPWFILVPESNEKDFLSLPAELRYAIDDECAKISDFIRSEFGSPKINFAAIGNLVPQMHLHVVGRHPEDPCWPAPVWGNLNTTAEYSEEQIASIKAKTERL